MSLRRSDLLVAVTILALACGPSQQAPASGSADGQPRHGGQLNVTIDTDPFDWDISFLGKSNPNVEGLGLSYNSLLKFKSGPGVEFTDAILEPDLAERWDVSPDARTFTFHLRRGVKYASIPPVDGRELTAADVKWTLEYRTRTGELKDKGLPPGQVDFMFEGMDRVENPDPYTVIVRFKEPFIPFINYGASRWNPTLPREIYDQDGHLKDRIAGPGPYILDTAATQKGTRWVWKKNPNYWDSGKPYLDEIRWIVIAAEAAQFAAFQAKQLDIAESMLYNAFQDVKKGSPQGESAKYYGTNAQMLMPSQVRGGPLTDVRVRRAISMSIDRDEMNRLIAGGESRWAVPGASPGFFSEAETRQLVRQDVEEAKRLLAQAGYPNGLDLEWPIPRDESQGNVTMFTLIQAQMKRAGINGVFRPMDLSEQRTKRRRGDYDIDSLVGGTGVLNSDIDSLLYGRYHSTASQNYSKFKDAELDKLLEESRRVADAAKRQEILRNISLRLIDQWWTVDTIYIPRWDAWHPYVKNYAPHFTDKPTYRHAWLERP